VLLVEAHDRTLVDAFLERAHARARDVQGTQPGAVSVYPPIPALLAKRAGFERSQMLAQATRRGELQRFLTAWHRALLELPGKRVRWSIDVDPAGF
jgi:primosomal protein N' (replication factor Y)